MTWITQTALALTRLGNALLGGLATESMSSRAHRMDYRGKLWGQIARPLIDLVFRMFGQQSHCEKSYASDRNKPPLPVLGDRQ